MISRIPPATLGLLIANAIIFLLQALLGDPLLANFMLWPLGGEDAGGYGFQPWQLISYGFLHGNEYHLFFNLLALYMFGAPLEQVWGSKRFLQYFLVCVLGAGLVQIGVGAWMLAQGSEAYPTVGASGGVFGLLLGYAMLFPHSRIMLLFPPIPMPAWLFVTVYGVIELYLGITGTASGVAHFAHLGGMVGGYLMIQYGRSGARRPRL